MNILKFWEINSQDSEIFEIQYSCWKNKVLKICIDNVSKHLIMLANVGFLHSHLSIEISFRWKFSCWSSVIKMVDEVSLCIKLSFLKFPTFFLAVSTNPTRARVLDISWWCSLCIRCRTLGWFESANINSWHLPAPACTYSIWCGSRTSKINWLWPCRRNN